jgi:hypothetical protein
MTTTLCWTRVTSCTACQPGMYGDTLTVLYRAAALETLLARLGAASHPRDVCTLLLSWQGAQRTQRTCLVAVAQTCLGCRLVRRVFLMNPPPPPKRSRKKERERERETSPPPPHHHHITLITHITSHQISFPLTSTSKPFPFCSLAFANISSRIQSIRSSFDLTVK